MALKERQRRVIENRIQGAGAREQRGIDSFFGRAEQGLQDAPGIQEILEILRRSPEGDLQRIRDAVFSGITEGAQPQLEQAVGMSMEQAAALGIPRSTLAAGMAANATRGTMAPLLGQAQSQYASLIPSAMNERRADAGALGSLQGQAYNTMQAALLRDLNERSQNRTTTERSFTPGGGMFKKILGAGLGVGLGALTGGLGTAAAGGIANMFGGGGGEGSNFSQSLSGSSFARMAQPGLRDRYMSSGTGARSFRGGYDSYGSSGSARGNF